MEGEEVPKLSIFGFLCINHEIVEKQLSTIYYGNMCLENREF